MGFIGLVLSVGVSLWFGIHWGVILGAIFAGVIVGLVTAKPTRYFQPALGQIIDLIAINSRWIYAVVIWAIFGWQSALSSAIIGWFSCSMGIYIMCRLVRKITKQELALEIDLARRLDVARYNRRQED